MNSEALSVSRAGAAHTHMHTQADVHTCVAKARDKEKNVRQAEKVNEEKTEQSERQRENRVKKISCEMKMCADRSRRGESG